LQSDSNLRANLRIGAKSASQQFAWDKNAARVLAFYADLQK
jgi:hypothetical protein